MKIKKSKVLTIIVLAMATNPCLEMGFLSAAEADTEDGHIRRGPIKPLPLDLDLDEEKVELGRELFHDTRLSKDDSISCATCHDLRKGGVDQLVHPIGIYSQKGELNVPTVFNSGFNFKQFWDGRADSLEEQVAVPIHGSKEMGSSWEEVVAKLSATTHYQQKFRAIYSDGIQADNIADAIAEFERSLVTPNSRFDQYLRGDDAVLSEQELKGYKKFKSFGCSSCHQGVNVGGNMYQTLGAMFNYFEARGNITKADFGRYNVTGREEDRYVFKVPSLRNVALTAPYFHDGSAKKLEDAVAIMAEYQLGIWLEPEDIEDIVAFLRTLTGEYERGGK